MTIYFFKFPLVPTLGGAEFHTLKLAKYFASQGHQIKLLTSDQYLFRLFEKHHLPRRRVFAGWEPTSKWSLLLWPLTWAVARSRLKKIIRAAPADSIFFCQSLTEKLILPSILHSIFSIPYSVIFLEHKIPGRWLTLNPLKFLYLKYANLVQLITVSHFAKQEFVKLGVPEKCIGVIYPSTTPVIARVIPKQSQFTIGILGRLDPEKGALKFLKSVIPGLARNPDWRILIAGEGGEQNKIQRLIGSHNLQNQIIILGFVHNLDEFFSQISVLAYPTLVPESFGLAVLEAMSHGIPVIASNLGAISEIIKHGEDGFLVNGEEEWIKYLGQLETPSVHKKLSAAARLSAQNFSEQKMLQGFEAIIQNR